MKPFVLTQYDKNDREIRELREQELPYVAGGLKKCGDGKETTVTVGPNGGGDDGCDAG